MNESICIDTDAIADGDLMAYLHGEAPRGVVEHVAQCAHCARQVEHLKTVDARLLEAFYRTTCPTAEVLTDFALGWLPAVQRLRVAAHVRGCAQCTEEVAAAREWGREEPASLIGCLQEALALARIAQPFAQTTTPVRGRDWQGRFEIDDLIVTLSLHGDHLVGRLRHRGRDDISFKGQVWLIPEEATEDSLLQGPIDPQGRFHIKATEPTTYALLLRVDGRDVAVERIRIV